MLCREQAQFAFGISQLQLPCKCEGPAENDVVMLLLDEIMVDGFVTEGEPLLITQPADLIAEVEDWVSEHL